MTYSSSNNNQLSAVGGASVSYDAAGNLTQDLSAPHTYQWDAEGRMRQIDSGTSAIITTFNALGQRAYRQNSSNFSASYSYDPSGQYLGGYGSGWWNAEVPFAGRLLAEYASGSPAPAYFDHPNALGSEFQWTNAAGGSAGEVQFYPWGAKWGDTTSGNLYQYYSSLQQYDPETDGYQTPNRYYIPRLGRWLTPDPQAGEVTIPQSLNRYAYVLDNPTSLTDPLGLDQAICSDPVSAVTDPSCVNWNAGGGDNCGGPGGAGPGGGGGPIPPPVPPPPAGGGGGNGTGSSFLGTIPIWITIKNCTCEQLNSFPILGECGFSCNCTGDIPFISAKIAVLPTSALVAKCGKIAEYECPRQIETVAIAVGVPYVLQVGTQIVTGCQP